MLDFEFSEQQKMFRTSVHDWAEKEVAPLVDEAEEKEEFPKQLFLKAGKLGYLGLSIAEKDGGAGMGQVEEVLFKEDVARVCAGIAQGLVGLFRALADYGTEEQKQKWLYPGIKGEKISALGLTEPAAGSDAAAVQATAVKDGDSYILNGNKIFTTNGVICDYVLFFAYTDKSKGAKGGMSMFIVEKGTPGFTIARKMRKMGIHSAATGEEFFDNCRVPKENLIGEEGQGFPIAMRLLERGRLWYAAYALGIAQAALEASIKYANERVQFGQPIGKNQAISFKIVDMATIIEASRWLLYRAAWLQDKGVTRNPDPYMAKLLCAEMAVKVTTDALQVHGGYGLMAEHPVQRYFRDAKMFTVLMGTSQIQQFTIARSLGL